jgi:hypothetical protein
MESSPRRIERARQALARDKGVAPEDLKYIGDQEPSRPGKLGTHLFNIMDPSHPNYKSTVGWPMERTIETTQGDIMSIWTEVQARGIQYDTHESDLYIPVNDETRDLLQRSGHSHTAFFSSKDHKMWFDIPFAYEPWWEKRTGNRMKGNPWKARVRDTYSTLGELEAYDETYGIVKRLGYRSARRLWDANPVIGGSVYPEDLRVMRKDERLPRRGAHLPPARRNPRSGHTPGPWDVQNKGNLYGRNARHEVVEGINKDGSKNLPTICKMPDLSERSYANARLIASAPELLGALEAMLQAWRHEPGDKRSIEKAKQAIEKAKGE